MHIGIYYYTYFLINIFAQLPNFKWPINNLKFFYKYFQLQPLRTHENIFNLFTVATVDSNDGISTGKIERHYRITGNSGRNNSCRQICTSC